MFRVEPCELLTPGTVMSTVLLFNKNSLHSVRTDLDALVFNQQRIAEWVAFRNPQKKRPYTSIVKVIRKPLDLDRRRLKASFVREQTRMYQGHFQDFSDFFSMHTLACLMNVPLPHPAY